MAILWRMRPPSAPAVLISRSSRFQRPSSLQGPASAEDPLRHRLVGNFIEDVNFALSRRLG